MDTKQTSEVIRDMAKRLREYSVSIEEYADELDDTGNFEICGEVAGALCNLIASVRIDLLVNRPVRTFSRELDRIKKDSGHGE